MAVVAVFAGAAVAAVARGDQAEAATLADVLVITAADADAAVREALAGAPDDVVAVIAGGVTLGEYEAAARRAVACLRTGFDALPLPRGYTGRPVIDVSPPETSADGFSVTYSYGIDTSGMAGPPLSVDLMDPVSDLERRCHERHLVAVQRAYRAAKLSDAGYVASVTETFLACVRAAGVRDVGEGADDVLAALEASARAQNVGVMRCLESSPSVNFGLGLVTTVPGG